MSDPTRPCPSCGREIPGGRYCVRCGAALPEADEPGARRGFAAAPHEPRHLPRPVSTLYPRLPRASVRNFETALVAGFAAVIALAFGHFFIPGLVLAALLVPFLTVLYLYDVDVYEGEPLSVVALTMAWGAAAGVGVALLGNAVARVGAGLVARPTGSSVLSLGLLLPVAGVLLALAGPLLLLTNGRFNDAMDGATFGAASAVSFGAAEAVVHAVGAFGAGLRPSWKVLPWLARLTSLAVVAPVLAAAAVGAAAGAFWLRFRSPRADREALGPLGHPAVAVVLAAALVAAGAVAQVLLPPGRALGVLVVLAVAAVLWLRSMIHVGLTEEAGAVEVGPPVTCANCGRATPHHTFCAWCGVALRALPKTRAPAPAAPSAARPEQA